MAGMRRRDLFPLAGAAVAGWPLAVRAQQPAMPVMGYLSSKGEAAEAGILAAVRKGLAESGFVEGRTVSIAYRWSEGEYDRLPAFAADLVARKVNVIMASGVPATLAAKAATSTIPIVFRLAIDPVAFGLVQSLNRPGGNLTGVTMLFDALTPKKLQLLHELVPTTATIGFLINPKNQNAQSHQERAVAAARTLGLEITVLTASSAGEFDAAFTAGRQQEVRAVLVGDDPFFDVGASRHAIPTMYYVRDFVVAGGLISYGPSFEELSRQAGVYAGRILKGANPAELPVAQPTRIELVINLNTAKALGLAVPPALLTRADEVIE
jgi:putative tryptophan/tyrosine transport system substrate-binding protein